MRSLLRFIINNQYVLLFLLLEIIAGILVVRNNKYPQTRYINWAQTINGYFSEKKDNLVQYFSLKEVNIKLASENTRLLNEFERFKKDPTYKPFSPIDSSKRKFEYILAKVVNNSINKQYNYITINKGSKDGIEPDMAVIAPDGIVGVVESVSENFSIVMSLLNRNIKISAKFKKNNFFGPFEWGGFSYRKGYITDIPLHVQIQKGDTVVTSGFSALFPDGLQVGYVSSYGVSGGNFYKVEIDLSCDFKNLSYVNVIKNYKKDEQVILESSYK
jgi:rod shape-determining protein MreC